MADEKKKICPLTWATEKGAYDQQVSDFTFCPEQQCAWWNHKEKCCSLKLIAEDLNHIASHSKLQ
jgi:hypothetical protein